MVFGVEAVVGEELGFVEERACLEDEILLRFHWLYIGLNQDQIDGGDARTEHISIFSGYKPNSALQASSDVHLWTPNMFLIISSCSFLFKFYPNF